MKRKEELPDCPVATTLTLLNSKWKLLIVRNLLVRAWRFNELKNSLEGISQKVLTESLKSMEADGIITRTEIEINPPKVVEYALSPLGETMKPILDAMQAWGSRIKRDMHKPMNLVPYQVCIVPTLEAVRLPLLFLPPPLSGKSRRPAPTNTR